MGAVDKTTTDTEVVDFLLLQLAALVMVEHYQYHM